MYKVLGEASLSALLCRQPQRWQVLRQAQGGQH